MLKVNPKNFLTKILQKKQIEIDNLYQEFGLSYFIEKSKKIKNNFSFAKALNNNKLNLIAEVKKASPSKGIIRKEFDYLEIAKSFEKMGASAISVLTEKDYFLGSIDYLSEIKKVVSIPILRKDFIFDPIQVYEAKAYGADAILLIKAVLSKEKAQELLDLTSELDLDTVMEIHSEQELSELKDLKNLKIIGINNRDLNTFKVNTNTALSLNKKITEIFGDKILIVAESGYQNQKDLAVLKDNNFNAVLIGEGLVNNPMLSI
ncbi:indole-3-glycerol phosphate synthase TrpC [Candidatus Margulisiibacteriota bacterium]